jgi:hypothetical protein
VLLAALQALIEVGRSDSIQEGKFMTTIAILPENPGKQDTRYRAVAGTKHSSGRTAGEALDALSAQLDPSLAGTLVVVQQLRPDHFFTADQQEKLEQLMARWRTAREAGQALAAEDQAALERLAEAELKAASDRAAAL